MKAIYFYLFVWLLLVSACNDSHSNAETVVIATIAADSVNAENVNASTTPTFEMDSCATAMFEAITIGDLESLELLLGGACSINDTLLVEGYKQSPLLYAVVKKDAAIVRVLLEAGATSNDDWAFGLAAVKVLTSNQSTEIFHLFLEYGADINLKIRGNREVRSPLKIAVENAGLEQVRYLLENGANPNGHEVNIDSFLYYPPLVSAIGRKGNLEIAELLIAYGADVDKKYNGGSGGDCWPCADEITLLHDAYWWSEDSILQQFIPLIIRNTRDINIRNHYGETPLDWVSYGGDTSLLELYIDNGAHIEEADRSALIHAAYFSNAEMIRELLSNGADPNFIDKEGYSAVYYCLNCCSDGFGGGISDSMRIESLTHLLQYGADISITPKTEEGVWQALSYKPVIKEELVRRGLIDTN